MLYGLALLDPSYFYPAACIICALVSLTIGSSWTTAGTVGLALIGIAQVMGLSPEITAGAVISGAYFGDKMSPLSETTNLAPGIGGAELFDHVRHMFWPTAPTLLIALVLYSALALGTDAHALPESAVEATRAEVARVFNLGIVPLYNTTTESLAILLRPGNAGDNYFQLYYLPSADMIAGNTFAG